MTHISQLALGNSHRPRFYTQDGPSTTLATLVELARRNMKHIPQLALGNNCPPSLCIWDGPSTSLMAELPLLVLVDLVLVELVLEWLALEEVVPVEEELVVGSELAVVLCNLAAACTAPIHSYS